MNELAALPVRFRAPVAPALRARLPVPLAVMVMVLLVSVEVMSVPIVPFRTRPLVRVPAVWVMLRPLVVVPLAPLILTSRALVTVPAVLVLFIATLLVVAWDWLKIAVVAAVLEVALTVRPTTEAAVGVTVFWPVVPGTSTRQVAQAPAATQDKAPAPSFCRLVAAPPWAVGRVKV